MNTRASIRHSAQRWYVIRGAAQRPGLRSRLLGPLRRRQRGIFQACREPVRSVPRHRMH